MHRSESSTRTRPTIPRRSPGPDLRETRRDRPHPRTDLRTRDRDQTAEARESGDELKDVPSPSTVLNVHLHLEESRTDAFVSIQFVGCGLLYAKREQK